MKKMSRILKVGLALVVALGLTACGGGDEPEVKKEVALKTQTINEMTLDVPEDFGEFADANGTMLATDPSKMSSIVISAVADGQGTTPEQFTEEAFKAGNLTTFTDVEMLEYSNDTEFAGVPVVIAHFNAKNSKGAAIEMYNYVFFFEGGALQTVAFSFSRDADSSLKTNIDQVLESIAFN